MPVLADLGCVVLLMCNFVCMCLSGKPSAADRGAAAAAGRTHPVRCQEAVQTVQESLYRGQQLGAHAVVREALRAAGVAMVVAMVAAAAATGEELQM